MQFKKGKIILPLMFSTTQFPFVPSGMIRKVNGAALGLTSSSKAVAYTVFLSEHRLVRAVVREGQWSLESATCMAIVPVAVFAGISAGDISSVKRYKNTTKQRVGQHCMC